MESFIWWLSIYSLVAMVVFALAMREALETPLTYERYKGVVTFSLFWLPVLIYVIWFVWKLPDFDLSE